MLGSLGDIVFSVSRDKVLTFDKLKWNSSAQYATHKRHLKTDLLEHTGLDTDKISFSMYFSIFLGVDPMPELVKLFEAERAGKALRLVIGKKAYGKYKWVIKKQDRTLEHIDNEGNVLEAAVNISLEAYSWR